MSDKLPPKIMVIEPDEIQSSYICNTIERYWFNVERVSNILESTKNAALSIPNVIIISSKINSVSSAVSVASNIRMMPGLTNVPVIFLLDEGEQEEKYILADNSLVELIYRPFTPNEIILIIKSLLRKSQPIFQDKIIRYKDIKIDLASYKVYIKDRLIHLGPTEFKILQLFVQSPKIIYSREQIIDYVWKARTKIIDPRTVDVHVNRLRNLIKLDKKEVSFIQTVRSRGYCLNLPGEID